MKPLIRSKVMQVVTQAFSVAPLFSVAAAVINAAVNITARYRQTSEIASVSVPDFGIIVLNEANAMTSDTVMVTCSPERTTGRRDVAFIPLRFERQADGFRPHPEGQGNTDAPMLAPQSGIRFNLDY